MTGCLSHQNLKLFMMMFVIRRKRWRFGRKFEISCNCLVMLRFRRWVGRLEVGNNERG